VPFNRERGWYGGSTTQRDLGRGPGVARAKAGARPRRKWAGGARARKVGAETGEVGGCQLGPHHSPGRWGQIV
jgi:hypothetical protein